VGRARQSQADTGQAPNEQTQKIKAAAAIAAMFVEGSPTIVGVAAILLPLLPAFVSPGSAARIAEEAATLALIDPPVFKPHAAQFEQRASLENVLMRSYFAQASAQRFAQALRGPSDLSEEERIARQRKAEHSYLTAHQNARARNLKGAKKTDAARELFGDVLSWNHGVHGHPIEPRPAHVAADGRVWDLRRGVPISTGALPSVLPGCTCDWGPAKSGAQLLT
jgi:hypothetical protein